MDEKLIKKLKKHSLTKDTPKSVPETPGVYVFSRNNLPIYVGKAKNLKNRVSSYFSVDLSPKTSKMFSEADSISWLKVDSELSALLLEARCIRNFQPKYNVNLKDDKHPLYIKITKEKYPRVTTARKLEEKDSLYFYGPFPNSGAVRSVLKLLRRVFPYSDHKLGKKPCLYSQIGQCNPCPNEIEKIQDVKTKKLLRKKYLKNIRYLQKSLSGKFLTVKKFLLFEMKMDSKEEKFEEAGNILRQIKILDYITQPYLPSEYYLDNPNLLEDIRRKEISQLSKILSKYIRISKRIYRIECYDISHLAGTFPTASMVTFINGEADKNYYRHFKIRQFKTKDDLSSMREVAKRRSKYFSSWGKPDLIIVDGGKTQVSAFTEVLDTFNIPIIGLAKRLETIVIPIVKTKGLEFKEIRLPKSPALNLVQRIRDEAHRFAQKYHHLLLRKNFTKEIS